MEMLEAFHFFHSKAKAQDRAARREAYITFTAKFRIPASALNIQHVYHNQLRCSRLFS